LNLDYKGLEEYMIKEILNQAIKIIPKIKVKDRRELL